MKKSTLSALAVLCLTSSAIAQDTAAPAAPAAAAPAPAAVPADAVIITAGNVTIRKSDFENALRSLPAEYQQYALGPGKKQFAQDVLRMKLLANAGREQGLDKAPEIVSQLELMRDNLVANAVLQRLQAATAVSEEDLKKTYDSSKADHERVGARHILVAFEGSPAAQANKPKLTEEQAKAKADELLKKLVGGASFEELAKAESDDVGSGANGGSLGEFGHGQMVPEFEKAAFETPAGKLSQVVRTQFGYHIIRVDEHKTASFEEVRPTLERAERQKKLQAYLETLTNEAKPVFDPAYFGS